jgi:endoglycosylceramidase
MRILLAVVIAFLGFNLGAQASGLIHTDGRYFKDQQGRIVLLRGVNISNSSKVPPFNALTDLKQLQWVHDLGFNNVRLLFIWEAYEADRGVFNQAYLDNLGAFVKEAARLGISVVVDFHTDAFSRFAIGGCGSGFPKWTIPPDVTPLQPENNMKCDTWSMAATYDSLIKKNGFRETLDAFYSDKFGARSEYLKTFSQIAKYFSQFPTVLGYDVINEPWGDERGQLAPLIEDVAKVIRAQDPNAILFIEPLVYVAVGLSDTTLSRPSFDNFAYAAHNYDVIDLGDLGYFDGAIFLDHGFANLQAVSSRWNVPVYIGEFGGMPHGLQMEDLINHYYRLYDRNFISAAQWDFDPQWNPVSKDGWNLEDMTVVDPSGQPRDNFKIRPFAMAVSGTPIDMSVNLSHDVSERELSFSWMHDPKLGTTDFFVPSGLLSPDGSVNYSSPHADLRCSYQKSTSILSCSSDVAGRKDLKILSPKITAYRAASGQPLTLASGPTSQTPSALVATFDPVSQQWLYDASHDDAPAGWGTPLVLESLSDGNFRIPLDSKTCLDMPGGDRKSGATFNPHECGTSGTALNQEFRKVENPGTPGEFFLQLVLTGKCLTWKTKGLDMPLKQVRCDVLDRHQIFSSK